MLNMSGWVSGLKILRLRSKVFFENGAIFFGVTSPYTALIKLKKLRLISVKLPTFGLKYRFFIKSFFLICLLWFFSIPISSANVIRFPEKELAEEYVFPVFKNPKTVLNRNVTLAQRFELRLSGAVRTDEPFYHPLSGLGGFYFYLNEFHSIGLSGLFFYPGLTGNAKDMRRGILRDKAGGRVVYYFAADLSPQPLFGGFVNYQISPFYGKISITKSFVFNFALYSFIGLGGLALKHKEGTPLHVIPATHFGVGQRFYFSKYIALDGGIDFLIYMGPDPVTQLIRWVPGEPESRRPEYNQFEQSIFLRFLARVGITILI